MAEKASRIEAAMRVLLVGESRREHLAASSVFPTFWPWV
jgi:hypothetical protein